MEILSQSPDANAVLDGLPTGFSMPEIYVSCAEGELRKVLAQAAALAKFGPEATVSTTDGLHVVWPDGFGLLRSSNSTPVVVLRFEGHTPEALHRIETDRLALLHSQARCEGGRGGALNWHHARNGSCTSKRLVDYLDETLGV